MSERLNPARRSAGAFEKKLAAYAFAGGAALFSAGTAQAGIIIVDPTVKPTITIADLGSETFDLDMDNDGIPDFTFGAYSAISNQQNSTRFQYVGVYGTNANRFIAGPESPSFATNFADINAALTANPTLSTAKLLARYSTVKNTNIYAVAGNWPNNLSASGILGVNFLLNDTTPTPGFIEVSVHLGSADLVVQRWGYGTADESVPEPSSMLLFAMGAVGIAALRRRKPAGKQDE